MLTQRSAGAYPDLAPGDKRQAEISALTGSIHDASARLDSALDRLEAAVESRVADRPAGESPPALVAEVEALRAERDRMKSTLASLESRYAKLRQASETVSRRLDGTIGRIRGIVEE